MQNETQPTQTPPSAPQPQPQPPVQSQKNNILIPAAIVIAGLIVAGAVFFTRGGDQTVSSSVVNTAAPAVSMMPSTDVILPVTSADHILGSSSAKIVFVEYSDLECPFCKALQSTLEQLYSTYGANGDFAWVYRQFPLYKSSATTVALHPKAEKEAEASECANQLGGPTAFWAFIDKIFEITPSNNGLDPAELPIVAGQIGLNVTAFNSCLSSGTYTQFISDSYDKAVAAGGQGTPYSVMLLATAINTKEEQTILANAQGALSKDDPGSALPSTAITFNAAGNEIAIGGALPYDVMNAIVTTILGQ